MAAPGAKDFSFERLPTPAKILVLIVLLGLIGGIYVVAFHIPLTRDLDSEQARATELRAKMADAQKKHREYLRISEEVAAREALDQQNRRVLPDEAEMASFLRELSRLAELSGLQIALVEPRPEEKQDQYIRIPVVLNLSGKHHQVAKFFYNASRLERAISMENVQLVEPKVAGGDVVLKVNVLATTFRRPNADDQAARPKEKGRAKPKKDKKEKGKKRGAE